MQRIQPVPPVNRPKEDKLADKTATLNLKTCLLYTSDAADE